MLAEQIINEDSKAKFDTEINRIRENCPLFVEWLKRSLEQTIDMVGISEGETLVKQSGALLDIKTIFDSITATPEKPSDLAVGKVKVGLACM